jgi:hypothetical protein
MSRLDSRQCGILNISQPYRPLHPVNRDSFTVALLLIYDISVCYPKLLFSFKAKGRGYILTLRGHSDDKAITFFFGEGTRRRFFEVLETDGKKKVLWQSPRQEFYDLSQISDLRVELNTRLFTAIGRFTGRSVPRPPSS